MTDWSRVRSAYLGGIGLQGGVTALAGRGRLAPVEEPLSEEEVANLEGLVASGGDAGIRAAEVLASR